MRTKNRCYECIRCGYKTEQKWCMKSHLYNRKSPCPGSCNNIVMTDEIKEHILAFKCYKLSKQHTRPGSAITNNINNYHMMMNALTSMEPIEKLNKFMGLKKMELKAFGDVLSERMAGRLKHLEGKHAMSVVSGFGKVYAFEVIDEGILLDSIKNMDSMAVVYEKQKNRIAIYDGQKWNDWLMQGGVERIFIALQGAFFNKFEAYCIRRLEDQREPLGAKDRVVCLTALKRYYAFLASMGLSCQTQLIEGLTEDVVLRFKTMCSEEKAKAAKTEVARTRRRVMDIIKRNSQHNLDVLDKQILKAVMNSQSAKQQFFPKT